MTPGTELNSLPLLSNSHSFFSKGWGVRAGYGAGGELRTPRWFPGMGHETNRAHTSICAGWTYGAGGVGAVVRRVVGRQGRTDRNVYRADGSVAGGADAVLGSRAAVRGRRRGVQRVAGRRRLSPWWRRFLQTPEGAIDRGLAATSALLVVGVVFNVIAAGVWAFGADSSTAWTFSVMGWGLWIVAMGIFFLFFNSPLPRHSKRR